MHIIENRQRGTSVPDDMEQAQHKAFSLFQHHSTFLKTHLLMKTNKDQRQKYTLMNKYKKI
jgi:hypothetical protein